MKQLMTIGVRLHIKTEDIKDLLDSASRGSSYWCDNSLDYESETNKVLSGNDFSALKDLEEDNAHCLDLEKIKTGMSLMARKEPKHFADFITGDYDQNTGDVFLQCCLFGEVIYG